MTISRPGILARKFRALLWPVLLCLCACASALPPACSPGVQPTSVAWLVDQGWHTGIGLPAAQLGGPLAVFRDIFPGASVLMFGFGKRTFFTARVETLGELLLGPVPGPGAIQVVGLRTAPERAYTGATVVRLDLSPAGSGRLSDFLWQAIGRTHAGQPRLISRGLFPGSLFYAASHRYGPTYTCNTWSAQALRTAGLRTNPNGVVFASGLLDLAAGLPEACLASAPPPPDR